MKGLHIFLVNAFCVLHCIFLPIRLLIGLVQLILIHHWGLPTVLGFSLFTMFAQFFLIRMLLIGREGYVRRISLA